EPEVDEGGDTGRPERVDQRQRDGDAHRLPDDRQSLERRNERRDRGRTDVLREYPDRDREQDGRRDERRALAPGVEQANDHVAGARERVRTEEDPREADDVEREDATEPHLRTRVRRPAGRP